MSLTDSAVGSRIEIVPAPQRGAEARSREPPGQRVSGRELPDDPRDQRGIFQGHGMGKSLEDPGLSVRQVDG